MAADASLASSTKEHRTQYWIADLNTFVVDVGAYSADYASSLVTEDRRRIGKTREQICLPDELLFDINGMRYGVRKDTILTV